MSATQEEMFLPEGVNLLSSPKRGLCKLNGLVFPRQRTGDFWILRESKDMGVMYQTLKRTDSVAILSLLILWEYQPVKILDYVISDCVSKVSCLD